MKIKMTLRKRLLYGFGAIAFGTLISFVIVFVNLESSRKITNKNLNLYAPSVAYLNKMVSVVNDSKLLIKNWVFVDKKVDTPDKLRLQKLHNQDFNAIKDSLSVIARQWTNEERQQLTGCFITIEDTLFSLHEGIMAKLNTFESYDDPMVLFEVMPLVSEGGEVLNYTNQIVEELSDLLNHFSAESAQNNNKLVSKLNVFKVVIILIGLMLIAIAVFSGFITINRIITPINKLKKYVSNISKGDLSKDIEEIKNDEIGEMGQALREMTNNIKKIVTDIKASSETLSGSSKQINNSARDIATGANQQASSTEEVSASMEEMTASIGQNSENSEHTEKIANKVTEDVNEISRWVTDTAQAMRNITEKILVINDIAERIDLLAINAAIEAARAGEHGKGFAVVASEVRNLAESSQNAANEIDEVSQTSVQVAEQSSKLLEGIIPDIENTLKMVKEISASSREQNSGINQINSALQQLSDVTQRNSTFAEQLSASSDELLNQAEKLVTGVTFFKTQNGESHDESINEIEDQIVKLQNLLKARKNNNGEQEKSSLKKEKMVHQENRDKQELHKEKKHDENNQVSFQEKSLKKGTDILLEDSSDEEFENYK